MKTGKCPGCGGTVDQDPPKGYCKACGLRPIDYFKAKAVGDLRDQMAIAALTGLLGYENTCCIDTDEGKADLSHDAYKIADAMLAKR